jgi:signal transduction histidine kinase
MSALFGSVVLTGHDGTTARFTHKNVRATSVHRSSNPRLGYGSVIWIAAAKEKKMRLHEFILSNREAILVEWDAFATAVAPASLHMSRTAIRDHAEEMLEAIAKDLASSQTDNEQLLKSQGKATVVQGAQETAAQTHALLRARSGFDINEMMAEYRALRASVLRLWAAAESPRALEVQDTIRFNEAIDQSLTESVQFFAQEVERSRNLLLGMLAHDMRNPLQSVVMTAHYLGMLNAGVSVSNASAKLISSGARIQALLNDLVDFNRSKLGVGMRISPVACNLHAAITEEIVLLQQTETNREIRLTAEGDFHGVWDALRLRQVLANLVVNAFKYGDAKQPIEIALTSAENSVSLVVSNRGLPIPADLMAHLFEPLRQGMNSRKTSPDDGSLGLGLYIAKEIVLAHGGEIDVRSDDVLTTFTVVLPRGTANKSEPPVESKALVNLD